MARFRGQADGALASNKMRLRTALDLHSVARPCRCRSPPEQGVQVCAAGVGGGIPASLSWASRNIGLVFPAREGLSRRAGRACRWRWLLPGDDSYNFGSLGRSAAAVGLRQALSMTARSRARSLSPPLW